MWRLTQVLGLVAVLASGASAAQSELYHVSSIDLGTVFNSDTGWGSNPLSVAFDGSNAYVGGYNNGTVPGNIGVVQVSGLFGGAASFNPLAATQFSSPNGRGLDALDYHSGTGSLLMAHDGGTAAASFVSRRNAADGSLVWSVSSPQNARPFAMAVDPVGDGGNAGVGFLTQGSGRRRLLSMATGATLFDGATGGIINTSPDSGSTWRAMSFDDLGNIVVGNQAAYGYGVRNNANQWKTLAGALNVTTRAELKSVTVNNVGQGIAVLEDLGSDLLAFSARGTADTLNLTDSLGGVTTVSRFGVHVRNLDGSTTGLTQLELAGDENGVGTPWTGDIKNLAFGVNSVGQPTLLVVDFIGRRLDVYIVPEPATLGLLALCGLVVLRRR
jgi:hypothetical protein